MTPSCWAIAGMLTASAIASFSGAVAMIDFDSRPGERVNAPSTWPSASGIPRNANGSQLLVFAHPLCSCTAATLEEIASLPKIPTAVVFASEEGSSAPERSASWMLASRIAGADVRRDDGAVESKLFRVSTSGTVLLYNARGELIFEGGVSAARGHRGANLSLDRLTKALWSGEAIRAISPVFGCGLMRKQT